MTSQLTHLEELSRIFDRRSRDHPWLEAFRELEAADPTRGAVCRNWRMDHRVSRDREQRMVRAPELRDQLSGDHWWQRRAEHFYRTVCQPCDESAAGLRSTYVEESNGNNAVSMAKIPAHEQLIHVASLNRLLWRLTSAEFPTPDLELRFPSLTGRSLPARPVASASRDRTAFGAQVDEIADAVNQRGLDHVRELAGLLCAALGKRQPPWWAGFAHELMPRIERADWTGLCQALGMGHLEAGDWLVIWRYEIGEVLLQNPDVQLYRPTVVEAGDNPFHFPSPPGYPLGITMPLAVDQGGAHREVLHPPLRDQLAQDACRYELCRVAAPPVPDHSMLGKLRSIHRRRLARDQPSPDTLGWLDRHTPP